MVYRFKVCAPYMELGALPTYVMAGVGWQEFMKYVPFEGKTILAVQKRLENDDMVVVPGYIDEDFYNTLCWHNEYFKMRDSLDNAKIPAEKKKALLEDEMARIVREMNEGVESIETELGHYVPRDIPVRAVENILEGERIAEILGRYYFKGACVFPREPCVILKIG